MGAAMKRDELKELLTSIWHQPIATGDGTKLLEVIAWLERLPAGCDLVGCNPMSELDGTERAVYDVSAARGNGTRIRAWFVNPDDLTKAASQPRRCPRHGAYERVCQECLDEQRGKR